MAKKRAKKFSINVQPLRTRDDIDDMKVTLRHMNMGNRNQLLFLIGINTGLRCSDIVCLKVETVKQDNPIIREIKTGKMRQVSFVGLRLRIQEYIQEAGLSDDDWLFPSRKGNSHITRNGVYRFLSVAAEQLGRDDIGTHTMRKTYGYWFYKKFGDVRSLMIDFGHASQEITLHYIGITQDEVLSKKQQLLIGL